MQIQQRKLSWNILINFKLIFIYFPDSAKTIEEFSRIFDGLISKGLVKLQDRDNVKLTIEEFDVIKRCVSDWHEVTPRQIRIFYYRYLLAKRLLISRNHDLNVENIWQYSENAELFTKLILFYSNNYNCNKISEDKINLLRWDREEEISLDHFPLNKVKKEDYIELLNILEIVIAYNILFNHLLYLD